MCRNFILRIMVLKSANKQYRARLGDNNFVQCGTEQSLCLRQIWKIFFMHHEVVLPDLKAIPKTISLYLFLAQALQWLWPMF